MDGPLAPRPVPAASCKKGMPVSLTNCSSSAEAFDHRIPLPETMTGCCALGQHVDGFLHQARIAQDAVMRLRRSRPDHLVFIHPAVQDIPRQVEIRRAHTTGHRACR